MEFEKLSIPGVIQIIPKIVHDNRGFFTKSFTEIEYLKNNLQNSFKEEFYTYSHQNVLRGMHFQTPPFECYKIVSCLHGSIRDVLLDLRVGSPTYNRCEIIELNAKNGITLYLPPGVAHGFLVLSKSALVLYKVTCAYVPTNDIGIKWDSLPVDWGIKSGEPIISSRDLSFQNLSEFNSPFVYPNEDPI